MNADKVTDFDLFKGKYDEDTLTRNIKHLSLASVLHTQTCSAMFCVKQFNCMAESDILKVQKHLTPQDLAKAREETAYVSSCYRDDADIQLVDQKFESPQDLATAREETTYASPPFGDDVDDQMVDLKFETLKYVAIFLLFVTLNHYCLDSCVRILYGQIASNPKQTMEEIASKYRMVETEKMSHGFDL